MLHGLTVLCQDVLMLNELPSATPIQVVLAFCSAWSRLDLDAVAAMLAADIEYHNIPLDPLSGKPQVERYLRNAGPFDACRWDVVSIAAEGNKVLTERADHLVVRGKAITFPVMGIFEVEDGLIRRWRDYFDLASYRAQWPGADES